MPEKISAPKNTQTKKVRNNFTIINQSTPEYGKKQYAYCNIGGWHKKLGKNS